MWIEKTKNGKVKYCERVKDITGKTKKITHTMDKHSPKNEKIAREVLRLKEKKIKMIFDNDISFLEALKMFEDDYVSTLKEQTAKLKKLRIDKFKKLGFNIKMRDINVRFIEEVCNQTSTTPLSYNVQLSIVKNTIKLLYKKDYISDISFLMKLENKKHTTKDKIKYLEQEHIDIIMKEIEHNTLYKNIVEFLINTGLRVGECLALTFDDVNGDVLNIDKNLLRDSQKIGTPKNETSVRKISLNSKCLKIIESQKIMNKNLSKLYKGYKENNIIFASKTGGYLYQSNLNVWLKSNIKSVKGISPHIFRHTHASLCIDKGIPIELISSRLGHRDTKITREIYTHKTKLQKKKELEAFKGIEF